MELNMNKAIVRCKKKCYSDIEKRLIVDKFFNSGLSKIDFCKKEKLSTSALYRWQRQFPKSNNNFSTFIPIATSEAVAHETLLLQVKLTNGIEFFIPERCSPSYVAKVIKEISNVND